jgi:CDP-diacylglycerol--serine O-phosphatidyltransferase
MALAKDKSRVMGRGAYALPSLFTAGTIFCGYFSIMKTVGGIGMPPEKLVEQAANYNMAALAIGVAVFTDGMDGRIARMTNACSDFGRELDSLADVITFGVAPGLLAFAWGVRAIDPATGGMFTENLLRVAYLLLFLFVVCGAARLARFNVQKNPVPKNPGRFGRKYFVGLPIPMAAGMLAAVVHAFGGFPVESWMPWGVMWLGLVALLSFLMVCTWRYNSFKDFNLGQRRSFVSVILLAGFIYLVWNFSQAVLLAMSVTYVGSGIVIRIGGALRRRFKHTRAEPEHQTS